jgi:uncharacterized membrane protein
LKEQLLDFVTKNPLALIPLFVLVGIVMVLRYQRTKRRLSHVNDFKSRFMVGFGLVVAAVIIGLYLTYF